MLHCTEKRNFMVLCRFTTSTRVPSQHKFKQLRGGSFLCSSSLLVFLQNPFSSISSHQSKPHRRYEMCVCSRLIDIVYDLQGITHNSVKLNQIIPNKIWDEYVQLPIKFAIFVSHSIHWRQMHHDQMLCPYFDDRSIWFKLEIFAENYKTRVPSTAIIQFQAIYYSSLWSHEASIQKLCILLKTKLLDAISYCCCTHNELFSNDQTHR